MASNSILLQGAVPVAQSKMVAKWKFIAVTTLHVGPPMPVALRLPDGRKIFRGTASEALFLSHQIRPAVCDHLIIATCGTPPQIPNDIDWETSILRRAGKTWELIEDGKVHPLSFQKAADAANYALFRLTGKLAAVRILSAGGMLRQLVLCDMRPAEPGLALETADATI